MCQRLLREGKMPSNMRDRVKNNAEFAQKRLAEAAATMREFRLAE